MERDANIVFKLLERQPESSAVYVFHFADVVVAFRFPRRARSAPPTEREKILQEQ